MNEVIGIATLELSQFLSSHLPKLAPNWWQKLVVEKLSFHQQRVVDERGIRKLEQLDLAELLRVLDQNWPELANVCKLPHEGRAVVKELQSICNKWDLLSSEVSPPSQVFHDADGLSQLLVMIGSTSSSLKIAESVKSAAKLAMASTEGVTGAASADTAIDSGANSVSSNKSSANGRALFSAGDLVSLRSNPETILPVLEVISGGAEWRYRVFQNNTKATYYESQLQMPVAKLDELQVLTADELRAHLTSIQILSPSMANLYSLRSGRVEFDPYQYRPVFKIIRADRPRLLIADEVGVGKTIEAGLIIKELQARADTSSVLILCPKSLVAERKWYLEMKRFEEHFTAIDGALLKHCLEEAHLEGEWPEKYSKAIIPFSLFDSELVDGTEKTSKSKRKRSLRDLDPPPKFDLVIVDEAHYIRNSATILHRGVKFFCEHANAVVFLSATPIQMKGDDLFTLLNVLRPDLIIDHESFGKMAAPNKFITAALRQCRLGQAGWSTGTREKLLEAASTEWGRLFIRETPVFQQIIDRLNDEPFSDSERVALTGEIEELYTFSTLINRTRRRDIGAFTKRKPETLTVDFTPNQRQVHDKLLAIIAQILSLSHGNDNVKFMMTTIRRQAASCLYGLVPMLQDMLHGKLDKLEFMESAESDVEIESVDLEKIRRDIGVLLTMAKQLDEDDPKIAAFIRTLVDKQQLANNKAMVFSTFRHTLGYLATCVRQTSLRFGVVHGGIPDDERAEVRRRFKLEKEDPEAIDVLLSSEVGSEGLDFQFCDLLINYDLPWNPMRIEQRIGRIDRRGQRSPSVVIVNLITPGTVDAEIYERCLLRIGVFHDCIGDSEEILGEITQELKRIEESFELTADERVAQLKQIADNGLRQLEEDRKLEARQAELFGLNIPDQKWLKDIQSAENYWLTAAALQNCVVAYLQHRLAKHQDYLLGDKALKTLRLNQEARSLLLEDFKVLPNVKDPLAREWETWLKGSNPTLSVTFDQATAVENPKTLHISMTHPLIRQAARHYGLDVVVHTALEVESAIVSPGEYRFAIYRWSKQGVKPDQELVAVSSQPVIEQQLLSLLQSARTAESQKQRSLTEFEPFDSQHYRKWSAARANHEADNRQFVEYRIQSLTVSHRFRCKAINDQLAAATNDKIRLMRQSELSGVNSDFDRRIEDLKRSASSGDIHAAPVIFGILEVNAPDR